MNWLWGGLGAWVGINILYFGIRYFVVSPKRESEESSGSLRLDTSKRKNDVRFMFFG